MRPGRRRHRLNDVMYVQMVDGQRVTKCQGWHSGYSFGSVSLRIAPGRARGSERCDGRKAGEGHAHFEKVEGAKAAVMQYGYQ